LWKAHFCSLHTVWKPDYQNRLGAFRPWLYVVAFLVAWCKWCKLLLISGNMGDRWILWVFSL
jgi:hypothetical protein